MENCWWTKYSLMMLGIETRQHLWVCIIGFLCNAIEVTRSNYVALESTKLFRLIKISILFNYWKLKLLVVLSKIIFILTYFLFLLTNILLVNKTIEFIEQELEMGVFTLNCNNIICFLLYLVL